MSLGPTPWGTPLDVITAVRRVNKALRRRFDRSLHGLAFSYAQFEVLLTLQQDRNLHAAALARELKISPQAVQRLLDKLVLGDLVQTLPPDGGVVGLRITDRGRARARLAQDALGDVERRIASLSPQLRSDVIEALERVERALSRPLDGNYL
jgi:DNA-binding MarR family transcriptional regulator